MKKVNVAMMQMKVETDNLEKNLLHAEELLAFLCKKTKPDIALFPETADIGWAADNAGELADQVPGGKACEAWREMAKHYQVYLVAGLTERDEEKIYNTAVFFSPEGRLLAKHRKINILRDVEGMYEIGDRLHVVDTEFGRIGFDICADNFMSSTVLLHAMARMGAGMILSPCAWAVTEDYDNEKNPYGRIWTLPYGILSGLYEMPIVSVSNVGKMETGKWAGHHSIGNSMAYDAKGKLQAKLPFGVDKEVVRVVEIILTDPIAKGTDFPEALLERGYRGMAEDTAEFPKGHGDGSVHMKDGL